MITGYQQSSSQRSRSLRPNTVPPTHIPTNKTRSRVAMLEARTVDARYHVTKFSMQELSVGFHEISGAIRTHVQASGIKVEPRFHISDRSANATFRFKHRQSSYIVEFSISFCASPENLKSLKRSQSSYRVRATTLRSNARSGLNVSVPTDDLHLFASDSTSLSALDGADNLIKFVERYFTVS